MKSNSDIVFNQNNEISGTSAMFRSFAVPGWGHYYANPDDWRRGQFYMAVDAALITSLTLLVVNSNLLETNLATFARTYSGTDLDGRSRQFALAVANFNSLATYNAQQERTFNWDRLFPDTPENFWQWESEDHRLRYGNIRSRYDKVNRQIPTVIGLMVANRLISGISSFVHVRNQDISLPEVSMFYSQEPNGNLHPTASVRFHF